MVFSLADFGGVVEEGSGYAFSLVAFDGSDFEDENFFRALIGGGEGVEGAESGDFLIEFGDQEDVVGGVGEGL